MQLMNWNHDLVDLHDHSEFIQQKRLSILANAVDFLNIKLAGDIHSHERVLEVGCGAQSAFLDMLDDPTTWEGIDVFEETLRGEKTIATKVASVSNIPFENGRFQIVLANQSIEHWHEYHVPPLKGLLEIRRVLSPGGRAVINFPVHLHGNRIFVKGDFDAIDACFADAGLDVVKRTAVIDSTQANYPGWQKCGFPDFYTKSLPTHEVTSYVVEYEATPRVGAAALMQSKEEICSRRSALNRNLDHGLRYFIWKLFSKVWKIRIP